MNYIPGILLFCFIFIKKYTGCSRFYNLSLILNLIMFHPSFVLIQSLNLAGGGWRTAGRFLFVDVPVSNLCLDNVLAFLMIFARIIGHIPVIITIR